VLETERLALRHFHRDDAAFILRLLNEPAWLEHIGDRGVRTLEDAESYIQKGPVEMYGRLGFGLFLVELKEGAVPIGLCGLIKRDTLEHVDIGFAFLSEHWGKGYAFESASSVMSWARDALKLSTILAITSQGNSASGRLLEKLGFHFKGLAHLGGEDIKLYETTTSMEEAS
jgi:ribosomal-protein-alanine N-acetyltransferase